MKYLTFIILLSSALSLTDAAIHTVNGKIKMTIGGTSACRFKVMLMEEFVPVYEDYKQFLEVEFVPWGRTTFDENGTMICQFGPNDCFANRVQRCAINMLKGNQDAMVQYMGCEFTPPLPAFSLGTYDCAKTLGLNLRDLDECVTTTGDALDVAAQEAAKIPMQVINGIPYIVFNDVPDRDISREASRNLRSFICLALADDPTTGITHCPT